MPLSRLAIVIHVLLATALLSRQSQAELAPSGWSQLRLPGGAVQLAKGYLAGPSWYAFEGSKRIRIHVRQLNGTVFGIYAGLSFDLKSRVEGKRVWLDASITNVSDASRSVPQCGLLMGIDTNMAKYPEWNDIFFPTLLRCEKTHFWGYLMTPKGRILTLSSPDPVASYAMEYNDRGHRIQTFSLDLAHAGPLPSRHPVAPNTLQPGQKLHWQFVIEEAPNLESVKSTVARNSRAPMIEASRYTLAAGESTNLTITSFTKRPTVRAVAPDGAITKPALVEIGKGTYATEFRPNGQPGVTTLTVSDGSHVSEA